MITIKQYSEKINISVKDLKGNSRKHEFSIPRQVYWYYLQTQGATLSEISRKYNRKYPTIIHGIDRIKGFLQVKEKSIIPFLEALDVFSY